MFEWQKGNDSGVTFTWEDVEETAVFGSDDAPCIEWGLGPCLE